MTIVEILEEIGADHANIRREGWPDLFVIVNPCAEHMEIGIGAPGGVGFYSFPWCPDVDDLAADDWEYA